MPTDSKSVAPTEISEEVRLAKIEEAKKVLEKAMDDIIAVEKELFGNAPTQQFKNRIFGEEPTIEVQKTRNIEV